MFCLSGPMMFMSLVTKAKSRNSVNLYIGKQSIPRLNKTEMKIWPECDIPSIR